MAVDDEEPIRRLAGKMMESNGYRVVTAENGEEALAVYREVGEEIDLIILDLGMPGMGGRRCLEELLRVDPDVKVIVASGYSAGNHSRQVLEAGARGFVSKPYRMNDMLKKIRDVLDDKRGR